MNSPTSKEEQAVLAGGCFWGMQELVRKIPGVLRTDVGYCGGELADPQYPQVSSGRTGHAESLRIFFDPQKLKYADLLLYFFKLHDPTTKNQQGNDRGSQYRSVIFYTSPEQLQTAQEVIERVNISAQWKKPVVTEVCAFKQFWPAESHHQDYLQNNPGGYTCHYVRDLHF